MDFNPLNHVHKFVPHELCTKKEDYKDHFLCKLMVAYNDKRKLTPEEQKFEEMYAPNKTFIRRHATSPSHILRIIELNHSIG